jgi:hypothetical protein
LEILLLAAVNRFSNVSGGFLGTHFLRQKLAVIHADLPWP